MAAARGHFILMATMVFVPKPVAYIFDMDGVIIDSTEVHTDAWIEYLRSHGMELPDVGLRMLGKHNDAIVRDFFGHAPLTEDEIFAHGAAKERVYRERMETLFDEKLVPGIREFLEKMGSIPAGIGSNAETENVDFVLEKAGLRHYFAAVASGHDVSRPKPAPDIYLKVADMLNVTPSSCIVFEDSLTGVAAARAAGMRVVGVLTSLSEFPDVDLAIRDFLDPRLDKWLSSVHELV